MKFIDRKHRKSKKYKEIWKIFQFISLTPLKKTPKMQQFQNIIKLYMHKVYNLAPYKATMKNVGLNLVLNRK